jgi:hypothetical protein
MTSRIQCWWEDCKGYAILPDCVSGKRKASFQGHVIGACLFDEQICRFCRNWTPEQVKFAGTRFAAAVL